MCTMELDEVKRMRCSCPHCGAWMVHEEKGLQSHCVCPQCLHTCNACIGTGVQMQKGGEVPLDILLRYDMPDGTDQR